MAVKLPDGVTVHIANGLAAEKRITAITAANPPVATCTAHGLNTGDFVMLNTGWGKHHENVFKVESASADTFKVLGIDARTLDAADGVGGFRKVTGWTQIKQILNVNFEGGEQQYANFSFLEEDFERQIPTTTSARTATFSIADDPTLAGYQAAKAASDSGELRPMRVDLKSGSQIIYNGYAAFNDVPTLEKGNVMTVSLAYALSGKPNRY